MHDCKWSQLRDLARETRPGHGFHYAVNVLLEANAGGGGGSIAGPDVHALSFQLLVERDGLRLMIGLVPTHRTPGPVTGGPEALLHAFAGRQHNP